MDFELSLFVAGTLARIESILSVIQSGTELEGENLSSAVGLTVNQDGSSTRTNFFHHEYVVPTLSEYGHLTLVGGDESERKRFETYLIELRKVLLMIRPVGSYGP